MKLGNIPQYDVKHVRLKLLDALNMDRFVSLQNGNLIQIFGKTIKQQTITEIIKKTITYKNIYKLNKTLFEMLDAYNNFKHFIKTNSSL